ncbi:MAG: TIGR03617 family F420-dependent LLM class oxidoreductase [Anaerolineales bacterium]
MKLDAALPPVPLTDVPALARAAEAVGFGALWTTETVHDPFLPLALIAEHTVRLRFGTAIAVSFARSPATLAYTAWDLAAQSHGRFILGLGTQIKAHIERRFGLAWPASVTGKLREQIQVLRALWNTWQNDAPLNFRGEYYKITLMPPFFNPGPLPFSLPPTGGNLPQAIIPIYIAGVNTGLAQLAGELCDGFHVHPFHTPEYLSQTLLPAIARGAGKAGRPASDVTISATIFAASDEAGLAFCRRQIAFYASTPSYRPVMQLHGWGAAAEKLSSLAARKQWDEMPAQVTDPMLETFVVQASENDLAAAIRKRYTGLAGRITLYLPFTPGERDAFWRKLAASFSA